MISVSNLHSARLSLGREPAAQSPKVSATRLKDQWWEGFTLRVARRPAWLQTLALGCGLQWSLLRAAGSWLVVRPNQTVPERPRSILVNLSDTEAGWRALDEALGLARRLGAELTLWCVVDTAWVRGTETGPYCCPGRVASVLQTGENLLKCGLNAAQAGGVRAKGRLVEGQNAASLLGEASAHDLVILGQEGRNWFSRLLLGAQLRQVVRWAKGPVLVTTSG